MAKKAVIVTFELITRIVVDIPEGKTLRAALSDDEAYMKVMEAARNKILLNGVENYMLDDNTVWVEDTECPADESEKPNVKVLD